MIGGNYRSPQGNIPMEQFLSSGAAWGAEFLDRPEISKVWGKICGFTVLGPTRGKRLPQTLVISSSRSSNCQGELKLSQSLRAKKTGTFQSLHQSPGEPYPKNRNESEIG